MALISRARSRTLKRDLREILLIVIGVIIALSANAVWDYFQDRRVERASLRQLLETTLENEQRIAQSVFEDSSANHYNQALWQTFQPGTPVDTLRIAEAAYKGYWFSDFHPLTGTYSALAQSGEMNTIRNRKLRADISVYAGELDSTMREWFAVADIIGGVVTVREAGRFLPLHDLAVWATATAPRALPRIDVDALRNNPDFRGFLQMQIDASGNRIALLRKLRVRTMTIRRGLEEELDVPHAPAPVLDTSFLAGFRTATTNR